MAQARIADPSIYKCRTHPTEVLTLCCLECFDTLICLKCVTSKHNGHKMCQMADVLQRKRLSLQETIAKLETDVIPGLDQRIKSMSNMGNQTRIEIQVKGDQLKRTVDALQQQLIAISKKEYSQEEIRKQITKMSEHRTELLGIVSESKEALKRSRVPEIVETERRATYKLIFPWVNEKPIFVSSVQNSKNILDQFGSLEHPSKQGSFTNAIHKAVSEKFMLSAEEMITLRYPFKVKYLVATQNDILVSNDSDNTISKLTTDNQVQKFIDIGEEFIGFGVCSIHGILVTANPKPGHEHVSLVGHNPGAYSKTFFQLPYPSSICVPEDGKVLFGNYDGFFDSTINLYHTQTGRILHRYGIMAYPTMIRTNKQNGDVGVVYNKERIFVLDQNLRPKFWYCGLVDSTPGEPDVITQNRMRALFKPWDICFDKYGNILIADYASSNILALNSNGLLLWWH